MISSPKLPGEAALRKIEIFSDLEEDQLKWFASSAQEILLAPGDILLHEGDPADAATASLYVGKRVPEKYRAKGAANPVRLIQSADPSAVSPTFIRA